MSGGGYIASSWMAMQHAYLVGTKDSGKPLETTESGKVKIPKAVLFSYLNLLRDNPSIFLEGWSTRLIIDACVCLWTTVCLAVCNICSWIAPAFLYAEVWNVIKVVLADAGHPTALTMLHESTFVNFGLAFLCLMVMLFAATRHSAIACPLWLRCRRSAKVAGEPVFGDGVTITPTETQKRAADPAVKAAAAFLFAFLLCGFVSANDVTAQPPSPLTPRILVSFSCPTV